MASCLRKLTSILPLPLPDICLAALKIRREEQHQAKEAAGPA
jgi:hypothetical protein